MCFVTDVLGVSLETLRPSGWKTFAVSIASRIIKELVLALPSTMINVDTLTQVVSCVSNGLTLVDWALLRP